MIKTLKVKKKILTLTTIKWSLFITLITLSIICDYYYVHHSNLLRNLILISLITLTLGASIFTKFGKKIFILAKEATYEVKSITWPNLKETLHITCIVIIATILLSLILWGLDNILIFLISLFTSIRL